jgi:acyl-CoA thioester hydrolase
MSDGAPMLLFRASIPVRWRDLDAFNHVNNSVFLTFLEEARIQWLHSLPFEWARIGVSPLLAASSINYRRPIEYPETVLVELFTDRVGASSHVIGHRILSARDESVLYSDGHVVIVWIDPASGRPTALPEIMRRAAEQGVPKKAKKGPE